MSQQSLYFEKKNSSQTMPDQNLKQRDCQPQQQQQNSSNEDPHQPQPKFPYQKHRQYNNQLEYEPESQSQQGRNSAHYQPRNDRQRHTNNSYQTKRQNNDNFQGSNGNIIPQSQSYQHYQAGAYNQKQTQSNVNSEANSNTSSNPKYKSNQSNNEYLPLNNYPQNINSGHYNGANKGNGSYKNNGNNYSNQYATNNGKNSYQQQQGKNYSTNYRPAGGNQQVVQNQKDKIVYQKKTEVQQNSGNSSGQDLPQLQEQRLSCEQQQERQYDTSGTGKSSICEDHKELNGAEAKCVPEYILIEQNQLLEEVHTEQLMGIKNLQLAEVNNNKEAVEGGVQKDAAFQTESNKQCELHYLEEEKSIEEGKDNKQALNEICCKNQEEEQQTNTEQYDQDSHNNVINDQLDYELVEFESEWVIWMCFSQEQSQHSYGFLNEQTFLQNNQDLLSFKTLRQLGLILNYTRFSHLSDFFTFKNTPIFQFADKQDSPYRQIDAVCFFKKGIKPIWEDEENSYGQDIQAKFTKATVEQIDEIYYFFISTVFSEEFPYHSSMNGFRFADKGKNTKKCGVRLEIWFKEISTEQSDDIQYYFKNLLDQKWVNTVLKWEGHNKKVSQKSYQQHF